MKPIARALTLFILMCLGAAITRAQDAAPSVFRWAAADLAFALPPGWQAQTEPTDGGLLAVFTRDQTRLTVFIAPRPGRAPDERPREVGRWAPWRADAEMRAPLDQAMGLASVFALRYRLDTLYGRAALAVEATSADGARLASGVAGLLPDDRVIAAMLSAPADGFAEAQRQARLILESVVFSQQGAPTLEQHQLVWAVAADGSPEWIGLALDDLGLYALESAGVRIFSLADGALVTAIPFDSPAQATGIAALDGVVYIGDRACRCIRRVDTRAGRWLDPFGAFAGGAPYSLAAIDGAIVAIDGSAGAYTRRTFQIGADGKAREGVRLPVTDQATLAELSSPPTEGAYPPIEVANPTLNRDRLISTAGAQAAAVGADVGLRLYDSTLPRTRYGGLDLAEGVPVLGAVSQVEPFQVWRLAPGDGLTCIYATDLNRVTSGDLGLDMAIRLSAVGGGEVAYNDDAGPGFPGPFGAYDAAVCAETAEPLTVQVEWVAGAGSYALAVEQAAVILPGETPQVGAISEAQPADTWLIQAEGGATLSLTMVATTGDLDPLLRALGPDGALLASNDDASDSALGVNAQILQMPVPQSGQVLLEATRWSGTGAYSLTIISTAP